ncbi:nucleotide exchange factor GrpE [Lactobacillus sp. PV034]|uniref:nucleotide exchange factor GrpE n=1 Tax=Lactobacillus sp. PV034 TaxID=2594495 RepID=UPI00223F1F0A|nr:nucleotide exchange factor GrpE [Lactobacillus sp. PV034]QNQ80339.1 nucleotide exchange factor GrpE [Lactobacillus sp. PV034]
MSKEEFPHEKDLDKDTSSALKEDSKAKVEDKQKTTESDKSHPEDNNAKISELELKIDALTEKNKELEDKYLRSEAENQNMQNRYSKERAQLIKYESQNLAKDVLPAMDNLERALAVKADDEAALQLQKGVQMTLDALVRAMNDHGITEIKAEGEKFDPNLHQAVQTVAAESDDQKDHVVQVLQKGYQYKDRTLRPAMVVVAQ